MEDEGLVHFEGYTENGMPAFMEGRAAAVHKPLIAASRMHAKGMIGVLGSKEGVMIKQDSWTGKRIRELVFKAGNDEMLRLYKENGVYNFYLQEQGGTWRRFNYDTGAGETVFPTEGKQGECFPPGHSERK